MASPSPVSIYTDGACSGNPGPGGWGAIVIDGRSEIELSGGLASTTNQRMELTGPIKSLRSLPGHRAVAIYSDSAYVVNCFRDKWYERWEQNGWHGAGKKPVTNRDLWEALLAEARQRDVEWVKVQGHAGDPLNERVDELARKAIPA